jgi:hypothetical protein
MDQQTVSLIVAGLGIGGTLGGIVVGHILSRSAQRKQWVLDRRHEEFQELIRAFDTSMLIVGRRCRPSSTGTCGILVVMQRLGWNSLFKTTFSLR